jgi:lipoprotein-anchoring transpeptidase ErfK/SrfK
MSSASALSLRSARRPHRRSWVLLVAVAALIAGCSTSADTSAEGRDDASADPSSSATSGGDSSEPSDAAPEEPEPTVSANVRPGATGVAVDTRVRVRVKNGTLDNVRVTTDPESASSAAETAEKVSPRLEGSMSEDGESWSAASLLEPGHRYRVETVTQSPSGDRSKPRTFSFRTADLPLERQTFPSMAPLPGETVGVGMPVIVQFDVPVTDRASIERHLSVETSPRQVGSWSWLSNNEVHWRPRDYWRPGTEVTVSADINSVPAGRGVFGQMDRTSTFTIGDALVSRVDVARHEMKVFRNGSLLRTVPVTAGKDGFTTRSGTKVIMEKVRHKTMDAATIGISPGSPEYYRLDVEYAMRVTYSGEFIHGAPWSEGSQGSDNVSHGCVGMSMTNAAWFFDLSKRGDVVHVTGTDRTMEPGNGYTDWNISFADFREGSALA